MQYIKEKILVGSDPEVFIYDTKLKRFVSAIDKLGGSKYNPSPLERDGFFVQEDNVLAEFNIPPAANENEFVTNIVLGLEMVKRRLPFESYELRPIASAIMPQSEVEDPRAQVFGCDPDFNAWQHGRVNPKPPASMQQGQLRSAGGHLLVGYDLAQEVDKEEVDQNIIRYCDLYLGVPSILMDTDTDRRQLYGKAGAYRSKSFGVEYRTLSSFWLSSTKTISWAYRNLLKAVKRAGEGEFIDPNVGIRIQTAINTANEALARDLIKQYDLEVC